MTKREMLLRAVKQAHNMPNASKETPETAAFRCFLKKLNENDQSIREKIEAIKANSK